MFVAGTQRRLDLGGAAHRLHRARKFRENRVARGIEHASPVGLQQLVEYFPMSAQGLYGAFLVFTHHAAVTEYIGHQDRRQATFDRGRPAVQNRVVLHLQPSHAFPARRCEQATAGTRFDRPAPRRKVYANRALNA